MLQFPLPLEILYSVRRDSIVATETGGPCLGKSGRDDAVNSGTLTATTMSKVGIVGKVLH